MEKPPITYITLLLVTALASACTLEHSRQSSRRFLQHAGVVAEHRVQRSSDWSLSSKARLCQYLEPEEAAGPGGAIAGEDFGDRGNYQTAVETALYTALQRHYLVQQFASDHSAPVEPMVQAAALGCEVMVQARVLHTGSEQIVGPRHGAAQAGQSLPGEMTVRVTLVDVAGARVLDMGLVRSRAGNLTPVADWLEHLAEDAMAAYVARLAAVTPRA